MLEIPTWVFMSSVFGTFGVGFAVGRYLKPTITSEKTHCKVLDDSNYWTSSVEVSKTLKDGKCVNVGCIGYTAKDKQCGFNDFKQCIQIG